MSDLAKLRREHAELVGIVRRLGAFIALPEPPAQTELFQLRSAVTATLIAHLKAEDWVLYPRLLASADATVARTAQEFSYEMGGLADAYAAYAERWGADAISHDWAGYCEATRGIVEALMGRITRE